MQYVVIKCGGSIVDELPGSFFEDLATLANRADVAPIIVHGGGPMISSQLKQLNVTTTFEKGLRVTTEEVLDVVEMVLSGAVNKQIVRKLSANGAKAIGLSGIDGGLIEAEAVDEAKQIGFVGQVTAVNIDVIQSLTNMQHIPVISPIGMGKDQQRYNINADTAAGAIAEYLGASLLYISDIPGVLKNDQLLHQLSKAEVEQLIEEAVIYGGMIPKVTAALAALEKGVPEVAIVSGLEKGALIDFVDKKPVGTNFSLSEVSYV